MLFALLEILVASLILIGAVTQIFIPLFRQTPFFPAFKKNSRVEAELELARQKVRVAELENERDELLKQAETLRNPNKEQ